MLEHLSQRHVFLSGTFTAVPRRRLRIFIKALGGAVIRSNPVRQRSGGQTRIPIHTIIEGNVRYGHETHQLQLATPEAVVLGEAAVINAFGLNDTPSERLERLRDAAYLSEGLWTEARWQELCAILEGWPAGEDLDLGVDYVNRCGVPSSLRTPLGRWALRLGSGQPEPRLAVVRSLALGSGAYKQVPVRHLAQASELSRLEVLELRGLSCPLSHLQHLTESPHMGNLRRLRLVRCWFDANQAAGLLAKAKGFGALEELTFEQMQVHHKSVRLLEQSSHLPSLKKVRVV